MMTVERPISQRFVIIDDHQIVLDSTLGMLQKYYPEAEIVTALTAQLALDAITTNLPDAVIIDLCIPDKETDSSSNGSHVSVGIQLLNTLMNQFPDLNLVVQTAHAQTLVRLKPDILRHQGGFTMVDKGLPTDDLPTKLDWALKGVNYLPNEMRTSLEMRPEWMEVLTLAFQEGLQDQAIAERLNIARRTVRHYWSKIQGALGVYPEDGKNIRIQTEIRAREEGLIDY
jgi:DNA-binding NarL/FixJ family response regulator